MSARRLAALISGLFAAAIGCAGTRATNPGSPAAQSLAVSVRLGPNQNVAVSSLSVCLSSLSFAPADGGAPTVVPIASGAIAVGSASAVLVTQASLPAGSYASVSAKLAPVCGSGGSLGWTNGNGSYVATGAITLPYSGAFAVSSGIQAITLDIQPFADQLAPLSSGAAAAAALEAVSGNLGVTYSTGVNLETPIEMLDDGASSNAGAPTAFLRSQTSLAPAAYDGTVTYALEVVATNADTSAHSISLVDSENGSVASLSVPAGTSAPTRLSVPFQPSTAADVYRLELDGTPSADQLVAWSARLVVKQVAATRTRVFIPLTSSYNSTYSHADDATAADMGQSVTSFGQGGDQLHFSLWQKNDSAFSQLSGAQPWTFEALVSVASGPTGAAALFDSGTGNEVAASQLTSSSATPVLLSSGFADSAADFVDQDLFQVQMAAPGGGTASVYRAGLWVSLTSLAHVEVYFRVLRGEWRASGDPAISDDQSRVLFDGTAFGSATLFHEITDLVDAAGTSCAVALYDGGSADSGTASGTAIPLSAETISSTSQTLERSAALSVPSGHRIFSNLGANAGPGDCTPSNGFLVIKF